MGAGDWVAGGVRRAVSGVTALLPGQSGEPEQPASESPEQPVAKAPEPDPDRPVATSEPAPQQPARRPAAKRAARRPAPSPAAGLAAMRAAAAPEPEPQTATSSPVAGAEATPATSPWSAEELAGFRAALDDEVARLREELDMGEADLADLVADSGDGSGDDQADAGSKTFEREHEMSVNANTREMLDQAHRALRRLDAGTYGICERCASPIAAARLRAFPRATLCIACKQAEERR